MICKTTEGGRLGKRHFPVSIGMLAAESSGFFVDFLAPRCLGGMFEAGGQNSICGRRYYDRGLVRTP